MTQALEDRRERLEGALAGLARARKLLEVIRIKSEYQEEPIRGSALKDIGETQTCIRRVQATINQMIGEICNE